MRRRTAGVVAVRTIVSAPALPRQADFSTDTWGSAFWFELGPGLDGAGTLMVSSGARLLRDLRGELNATSGDAVWSEGLLRRLGEQVRAAGATPPATVPTSGRVSPAWLRAAIWYTYDRDSFPRQIDAVHLPTLVTEPQIGTRPGLGDQATVAVDSFDPTLLASNPFGPAQLDEIQVEGSPPASTPSSSSSSSLWLIVLFAVGVALAGGDSK